MNRFIFYLILQFFLHVNGQLDSCGPPVDCSGQDPKYRTIDGTCNNLQRVMWGSTGSPYVRMVSAEYTSEPGDRYAPRGGLDTTISRLPLPRNLTVSFHRDENRPHPELNQMVMAFGQFLSHGIIQTEPPPSGTCCNGGGDNFCFPVVVVPESDTFLRNTTCLEMRRQKPFCPERVSQRQQFNRLSAPIDLSTVYGKDLEVALALRTRENGELFEGMESLLPNAFEIGVPMQENLPTNYAAGDDRANQQPSLAALHVVWMREHNRIARGLQFLVGNDWDDEKLYQEARRINIAIFQNIAYEEYLQAILNVEDFARVQINTNPNIPSNSEAYYALTRITIFSEMAGAAFRMGHSQINGEQKLYENGVQIGSYLLRDTFIKPLSIINESRSVDILIEGLVHTPNQQVDRFASEEMRNFFPNTQGFRDLISRNIQRGRDFGLANFNRVRQNCGLERLDFNTPPPSNINPEAWEELKGLYQSADDIDLFSGGLSEIPGNGGTLGPTFSCIIGRQFFNLKVADRFFFTHKDHPGAFTSEQIQEIRKMRLFDVICENTDIAKLPPKMLDYPINENTPISCGTRNEINLGLFVR